MSHPCDSCGMSIDTGHLCPHCVDGHGELQAFEVRFERMLQWSLREDPTRPRAEAEAATLEYMARMPAWRDHPELLARRGGR